MRLYPGKIDTIAGEIIAKLSQDGDIEVSDPREAQLDAASVLKEYLRVDKELTERAKDILEIRGLPHAQLGLGDEGITWICNQLVETFMQSKHVDEVFADDVALRKKLKGIVHKHMAV